MTDPRLEPRHLLALLLATATHAQAPTDEALLTTAEAAGAPLPDELQALARMIGHWRGTGTVAAQGDRPEIAFTSQAVGRWILGGRFLVLDQSVDFPDPFPDRVERAIFGWDTEQERYVKFSIDNGGTVTQQRFHVQPDGSFLTSSDDVQDGVTVLHRTITRIDGDRGEHVYDMARGDGPLERYITGSTRRVDAATPLDAATCGRFMVDVVPTEAQVLDGLRGHYLLEGRTPQAAAGEDMQLTGTIHNRTLFGGLVHLSERTLQTPLGPLASHYYVAWRPDANCYVQIALHSMGVTIEQRGYPVEGGIAFVHAGRGGGRPLASRSLLRIGADGGMAGLTAHTIRGAQDPVLQFEGATTRKRD